MPTVLVAIPVCWALLTVLTAVGASRRGSATPLAIVAGIAFPGTWAVWYVRDEHPYRRAAHRWRDGVGVASAASRPGHGRHSP